VERDATGGFSGYMYSKNGLVSVHSLVVH